LGASPHAAAGRKKTIAGLIKINASQKSGAVKKWSGQKMERSKNGAVKKWSGYTAKTTACPLQAADSDNQPGKKELVAANVTKHPAGRTASESTQCRVAITASTSSGAPAVSDVDM
jgi:hypothetical protein